MSKARIQIARADIIRHFDELPNKVFHLSDLARELESRRDFWRLTQRTSTSAFIDFLSSSGKLSAIVFPFPAPYKRKALYVWGRVPIHEVLINLKPGCYFSHYTAVQIHGLTEQSPKTIYVNDEQRLESWLSGKLSQTSIDAAFRRPVRITSQVAETDDFRVFILNGKNTGKHGVVEDTVTSENGERFGKIRFTNVERTLIDITVRPVYSGGVSEVLKAFTLAREKVSVNRLTVMLKKLAYIYPYHQAIGFYLERAGYKASSLDLFRSIPREFDFYLMHEMKQRDYVKDWRLFIPKGF
jgi:predicted transcriptional regulator of viral defense system